LHGVGALRKTGAGSSPHDTKDMRLSVGAVNVRTGHFAYFESEEITIRPEHIMASGALPPGFPPVDWARSRCPALAVANDDRRRAQKGRPSPDAYLRSRQGSPMHCCAGYGAGSDVGMSYMAARRWISRHTYADFAGLSAKGHASSPEE